MGVCDVCNKSLGQDEGYLLHGKLIAKANYMSDVARQTAASFGFTTEEAHANLMAKAAVDTTPWMACDTCISHFLGSEDEKRMARRFAQRWASGERIALQSLPATSSLLNEMKQPDGPEKMMVCRACGKEVAYSQTITSCPHCMTFRPGWVMVIAGTKDPIAQAHKERAGDYYQQGRKHDAISEFEKAVAIDPCDPTVYNNIGAIHGELGELQTAVRYLRKALELDPDFGLAKRQLAQIENMLSTTPGSEPGAASVRQGPTAQGADSITDGYPISKQSSNGAAVPPALGTGLNQAIHYSLSRFLESPSPLVGLSPGLSTVLSRMDALRTPTVRKCWFCDTEDEWSSMVYRFTATRQTPGISNQFVFEIPTCVLCRSKFDDAKKKQDWLFATAGALGTLLLGLLVTCTIVWVLRFGFWGYGALGAVVVLIGVLSFFGQRLESQKVEHKLARHPGIQRLRSEGCRIAALPLSIFEKGDRLIQDIDRSP